MRSRPNVRVRITPSVIEPDAPFVAHVELESKSETPVDKVRISFGYYEVCFQSPRGPLYEQEHVWRPGKLGVGLHSQDVRFTVPSVGVPTFRGSATSASYLVRVEVDIPWWPDREATFSIPVVPRALPDSSSRPPPLVSTTDGPRAGELYIELSADRDVIAPGETLVGSVSLANVSTRRVRGVEAGFIRREKLLVAPQWVEQRWVAQVLGTTPPEQESIPFRISLPKDAAPSLSAHSFAVEWRFEVRAKVAYGDDVVLSFPIVVGRRAQGAPPVASRKPYLVGRDRWGAVWGALAQRFGMTFDGEAQTLAAARGAASLELRREVSGAQVAVVGRIRYPHLGLDLSVHERSLSDLLASRKVPLRNPLASDRLVATAREPEQAAGFLSPELLQSVLVLGDLRMNDDELSFAIGRAATTTQTLTPVISAAIQTLEQVAHALANVPPPSAMKTCVPTWDVFARSVGGRLERGRMWIHGGEIGGERFELGTLWSANGSAIDTLVRLQISPSFDSDFSIDDPALSPTVREILRELKKRPGFVATRDAVGFTLPGAVADPETLRADLELAAKLVHGRRGLLAAGPFR